MWKLFLISCCIISVGGSSIKNVDATNLNITQKSVTKTKITTITTTITPTPITKHNNDHNVNNDPNEHDDSMIDVGNNDATIKTTGAAIVSSMEAGLNGDAVAATPSILTKSLNDIDKHHTHGNNDDHVNDNNDEKDNATATVTASDTTKDKRQTKGTKIAGDNSNHRTHNDHHDDTNIDDLENGQETVYAINPRQYLIRQQQSQQQQSQHQPQSIIEDAMQQQQETQQVAAATQLRNYPVTIRPHNTQLLEQSQEIQHFAYLQDFAGRQSKAYGGKNGLSNQGKKSTSIASHAQSASPINSEAVDEAEQRYAVAVEQPILTHARLRHFPPHNGYFTLQFAGNQQRQQQQQHPQQRQHQQQSATHLQEQPEAQAQVQIQPLQIIPEEQFLKILEAELKARSLQEDHYRRQEATNANALAASEKVQQTVQVQSLGSYGQKSEGEREREREREREYLQYVAGAKANGGGPRYLPLNQSPPPSSQHLADVDPVPPPITPQIAYYQPQISYKTLPNHPLAKSSLEKEIEKLLANNKPQNTPIQFFDSTNEPSALINHHHQAAVVNVPRSNIPRKYFGNSQPLAPALYQYNNYHVPITQDIIDAKKLGPVVYPSQQQQQQQQHQQQQPQHQSQHQQHQQQIHTGPASNIPVQISQFFYQEPTIPSTPTRSKTHRSKYGAKLLTTSVPNQKVSLKNELNYLAGNKYAQPIFYEIDKPVNPTTATTLATNALTAPTHFYPSPPDPSRSIPAHPTAATTISEYNQTPNKFRQYSSTVSSPSLSSIFVSQGTGIATSSRIVQPHQHQHQQQHQHHQQQQQQQSSTKQKTIEDLKQLHLPQPGSGKPLTQAEFQALVDAGYPVTAVPVPIPIPYEQYIKDHPEFRNQPPPAPPSLPANYQQLMHFAQLQQHHVHPSQTQSQSQSQSQPQQQQHQRQHAQYSATRSYIARPSEPSVKIISSPSPESSSSSTLSTSHGVTYLKTVGADQKSRRPRDENETDVVGVKVDEKKTDNNAKLNENNDKDKSTE